MNYKNYVSQRMSHVFCVRCVFAPDEELLRAISDLRTDLHGWDRASRSVRKSILERFLWLHSKDGAAIGATRETTTTTTTTTNEGDKSINEQKELTPSASVVRLASTNVGPTSLANASLESLYGAGASLLLMRITSWLRLTYTLRIANLLNLRAIATFCEDASGGLRFVHEFVEAGGILTLLSIVESGSSLNGAASVAVDPKESAANHAHAQHQRAASIGSHHSDPAHSISAEAAAAHAAEVAKANALQAASEIEKERSLHILLRISLTGRAFKEMICEQRGVGIIITCLATVARDATQEVSKQLLCQLGMANPRYASLVHEELLSVFRGHSSNSCKKMVVQTLYFLLSNVTPSPAHPLGVDGGATVEYDSYGNPIDHFTADARYVDATVSLYHINDFQLHYEANQLLKLLVTKHNLQESTLQALLALLKQKSQNTLHSPSLGPMTAPGDRSANTATGRSSRADASANYGSFTGSSVASGVDHYGGSDRVSASSDVDPSSTGTGGRTDPSGVTGVGANKLSYHRPSPSSKHSDPKTCAVKLLNELALMSYECCLRMTQLGVINLVLDCLCHLTNFELQHSSCILLYTLNNNVVESASLIRYMMSGVTSSNSVSISGISNDSLYLEFLKQPEQLHRHITQADVKKIQHNLHHPPSQTSFLAQRRLDRRQGGGSISRKGSIILNASQQNGRSSPSTSSFTSPILGSQSGGSRNPSGAFNFTLNDLSNSSASQPAHPPTHPHHHSSSSMGSDGLPTPSASAAASSLQGSFYSLASTHHNLEEEDAAFFAHGMASIARASEADLYDAQMRAERALEKERLAKEREIEEKNRLDGISSGGQIRKRTLSGVIDDVHTELSGMTKHKNPDTINVPALQLHFDSKLRLVDEGAPKATGLLHSLKLDLSKRAGGVHEGPSAGPREAGVDDIGQPASNLYTPFATHTTVPPMPAHTRAGGAAPASSSKDSAHLIFSQRVGLPSPKGGRTDQASEGYLAVHFKDLMHTNRSEYLQHGQPSVVGQGQPTSRVAGGGVAEDVNGVSELLLPDVIPHVEILDLHDGIGVSKKSDAAVQDELRRRRDEKRYQTAQAVAAAAISHAAATKYAKSTDKFEGFTGATIAKQKTADEFGTRKALTLEQSLQRRAAEEEAKKKVDAAAKAREQASKELLTRNTSNRTILQMAISLDGAGRTIDPRKWGAHRASRIINATTEDGAHEEHTHKTVLPIRADESDADRIDRLRIEAELADLRGGRSSRLDRSDDGDGGDDSTPIDSEDIPSSQSNIRRRLRLDEDGEDTSGPTSPSSTTHQPMTTAGKESPRNAFTYTKDPSPRSTLSVNRDSPRNASMHKDSPRSVIAALVGSKQSPRHGPMDPPQFGPSATANPKRSTIARKGTTGGSVFVFTQDHSSDGRDAPSGDLPPTNPLKRAPVNAHGKPLIRRSTVMVTSTANSPRAANQTANGLPPTGSLSARPRTKSVLTIKQGAATARRIGQTDFTAVDE